MTPDPGTSSGAGGVDAARAAKDRIRRMVGRDSRVNGIGLTRLASSWAVKVNVVDADDRPDLPESVDGVPVRVSVVGPIRARAT